MREAEAINQHTSIQNSAPYNFDPNACFYPSQWMATPVYNAPFPDSTSTVMAGPVPGYIGDPCSNGSVFNQTMSGSTNSPASTEYQPMDTSQSWLPSQFTMAGASQYNPFPDNDNTNVGATDVTDQSQALFSQYPYQFFDGNGERLARLGSSATKVARKNRMARQRQLPSHHYRHQTQNQRQISDQSVMMGGENCANNQGNWVYCSAAAASPMVMVPTADAPLVLPTKRPALQSQNHQKHGSADKRQTCRTEKNLKFLLQKVLRQSDVGNLGRIVLPKKEAESHLPQLKSRDGISIFMEDIGTSCDFVRANGLQEDDFIVIYADLKCGKYLIRGVKVRQNGAKSEGKQPAKKNLHKTAAVSSSPVAQAVR
ncbi:hypothetical protein K7X08_029678 [Anisodus acutangulus]|uniref:TF-B3 domain-containing protein n=1 Tax=Anisodus acutangulus TaxID=402998 RepID=A0A9Q1L519_9SOLA|nr:hypothetical protein K7X08_029678 [Anisodus acutangulus]